MCPSRTYQSLAASTSTAVGTLGSESTVGGTVLVFSLSKLVAVGESTPSGAKGVTEKLL